MFLIYQPEGSTEPQRLRFDPRRLMSPEMETLEKLTGLDYSDIVNKVQSGNIRCRRAVLYVLLKRANPPLRFEDVSFTADELEVRYSRQELAAFRERYGEQEPSEQLTAQLAALDEAMRTAEDDEEQAGKAVLPIVE